MSPEAAGRNRRKLTVRSVYQCLYESKVGCTKAELASKLNFSLPTIYQCLTELMGKGLIRYAGELQSTGGRRPQCLQVVADARVAVGISLMEDRIRMVVTDLYLKELHYRNVPHRLQLQSDALALFLAENLEQLLNDSGTDRKKLLGVGIAIPGVITTDRKKLLLAPTLGLRDLNLDSLVQKIPYPVFWENDATCSGKAEMFVRGGQANMAYLSLENGVGGAVLIGGKPYPGEHLRSGEFGHMCVEPAGLPCACGRRGCLEAYCSAQRFQRTLGVSLEAFFAGLRRHVPEYEMLWYDMLRHLSIGVNNIRMALDCDVVLGGYLSEYLEPYLPQLRAYAAASNTFESNADYLQMSVLRRHTVPLGAALHFIQAFLSDGEV